MVTTTLWIPEKTPTLVSDIYILIGLCLIASGVIVLVIGILRRRYRVLEPDRSATRRR